MFSVKGHGVEFGDLKRTAVILLIHYSGGYFGLSLWIALYLFLFISRLGGKAFVPLMMKDSPLCPGFPQHSQRILCVPLRYTITGCRDPEYLLVLVPKYWYWWLEKSMYWKLQSCPNNNTDNEYHFQNRIPTCHCCQYMLLNLTSIMQWNREKWNHVT